MLQKVYLRLRFVQFFSALDLTFFSLYMPDKSHKDETCNSLLKQKNYLQRSMNFLVFLWNHIWSCMIGDIFRWKSDIIFLIMPRN